MIIISFPNMVFSQNLLLIITASMAALVGVAAACSNGECRLHDECSSNQDCEAGLYCLACPLGFPGTRCVRSTITDQFKLLNNSLPFNKYAFLATHNAYAIDGYPSHTKVPRITFTNQEDSVMDQLNNGARALMLDTYDFRGDVWLCHSFKGKCHDYTAFGPAIDTLREIEAFLSTYPAEIVTIILEDYVRAPNGLTKVFTDAGLMKYWFPVTNMPKNGQDWPLVNDMVQNNQRLLVFTSIQSKEASEGIAYQWNYMVENQYGNIGMKAGSCTNRKESPPLNDTSRSLVLVNYFRCIPMKKLSCEDNSRNLINMLHTCNGAATNRWANFVAVDYYKRSEGGGSFQAVDLLNGKLLCGCDDIHACVEESQEEYNNNKGAQVELLQQDGLYITRSSDGLISRKEEIV
ncbi:PI-PLC X domain-containing protein At5g67130-like isoform X1 [Populus nigra]|uniref:PI-PLC X domain-containing protein At5g67130-like isoform X1 n=1 Tax=Populus nigra TaxID=3691 RepID=UPI002B269CAA|nr:PI-PLC X domain-containing protein At5g67130-like isoform X1 [Populus nigra]